MQGFDIVRIPGFLDDASCLRIIDEIREAAGVPAPVYGKTKDGSVDNRVRQVTRADVSKTVRDSVVLRLASIIPQLSDRYKTELIEVERPQFLHYRTGDFFVAHQDGNTPLIHDHTRFRKVSIVIFLNDQTNTDKSGYKGGSLILHGQYPNYDDRTDLPGVSGTLVAFPSETTHEVTPVEAGERFTIVSWYRGSV